ncbi:MAG: hypothetical protein P1V35_02465 [Planctomycetota bacterium]|nr:hypothetical protein [Planctomycetota bacterium]
MKTLSLFLVAVTPWASGWTDAPALASTPPSAFVQEPSEEAEESEEEGEKGDKHLKEWPALENKEVKRLVKARTEEMGVDAAIKLKETGAGVAPALIKALGITKDKETMERIFDVLDAVTGPAHTRLLAKDFLSKKPNIRRYALGRVAQLPDTGVAEQAEAAWTMANKKGSHWDKQDKYLAALCCAAAGSDAGLELLIEYAGKKWGKVREDFALALPSLRSDALSKQLIERFGNTDRQSQVECLRLLSLCGTKASFPYIKPLLDSGDGSLKKAAINACRGIIENKPPLGNISVFDAIDLANKWKERL